LICETGTNSPALRPEFKDLYLKGERPATASSQAAKIIFSNRDNWYEIMSILVIDNESDIMLKRKDKDVYL
jgi:hypothetical protein